jgi:hypothetical protein
MRTAASARAWVGGIALLLAGAAAVHAQPAARPAGPPPCVDKGDQLFLSPMGEPFRAGKGEPAPAATWFAGADADHDGRLTQAEMVADADRFFTLLDLDKDGEIAPDEVTNYESRVAPEIRLYQSGRWVGAGPLGRGRQSGEERREAKRKNPKGGDVYDGEMGAGRFAWLNIPEPVASADQDYNRGISRAEFRTAALSRFRLLDTTQAKVLTLAAMPPLPPRVGACPPPPIDKRRGRH